VIRRSRWFLRHHGSRCMPVDPAPGVRMVGFDAGDQLTPVGDGAVVLQRVLPRRVTADGSRVVAGVAGPSDQAGGPQPVGDLVAGGVTVAVELQLDTEPSSRSEAVTGVLGDGNQIGRVGGDCSRWPWFQCWAPCWQLRASGLDMVDFDRG
jgi:hypothetical protein